MHYFLLVLVTNIMLQIYVVNMLLSACLIILLFYLLSWCFESAVKYLDVSFLLYVK